MIKEVSLGRSIRNPPIGGCNFSGDSSIIVLQAGSGHGDGCPFTPGTAYVVALPGILATFATSYIKQEIYANHIARPLSRGLVAVMLTGLIGLTVFVRRGQVAPAFLCSAFLIVSMLAATAAGAYPTLLHSTINPAFDVTVLSAKSG